MKKSQKKKSLTFLITAGPTIEDIDPVRFISNRSSGRMGVELCRSALKVGHRVILVHGPIPSNVIRPLLRRGGFETHPVRTAEVMHEHVMHEAKRADVVIMCAAVADYRPVKISEIKVKKSKTKMILELEPTPDILAGLGEYKRKHPGLKLIGFALETGTGDTIAEKRVSQRAEALRKLDQKNLDAIVLNSPVTIGVESGDFLVLLRNGSAIHYEGSWKRVFAGHLIRHAEELTVAK